MSFEARGRHVGAGRVDLDDTHHDQVQRRFGAEEQFRSPDWQQIAADSAELQRIADALAALSPPRT